MQLRNLPRSSALLKRRRRGCPPAGVSPPFLWQLPKKTQPGGLARPPQPTQLAAAGPHPRPPVPRLCPLRPSPGCARGSLMAHWGQGAAKPQKSAPHPSRGWSWALGRAAKSSSRAGEQPPGEGRRAPLGRGGCVLVAAGTEPKLSGTVRWLLVLPPAAFHGEPDKPPKLFRE